MAFLSNDLINRVNLHSAVQSAAIAGGQTFFLVVLLRAGLSVPAALLTVAGVLAGRFLLRPAMLPLAKLWGLQPLLIVGTVLAGIQYPILAMVDGVGPALIALCLTAALGDLVYWPTYHAYFASIGDPEHRGHQISAREAIVSVVGIGAPLAAAWSILTLGTMTTFVVIGAIQVLSALPLIGAPNVRIKAQAPGAIRASRLGALLDASYGWLAACFMFTWQIALFLSLGSNLGAYGGAMALAALVGALSGLVLGRNIDMGHGRRAVTIAYGAAAALVLLRVFSFGTPWLAVLANALGSIVLSLMAPALGTPIYNLSKASPCPMRFSIATEAGYDVGCFAGCVMAAGIAWAGLPLWIAVLMTLPALAASTWLLRRYYADNPTIEAALKA